MRSPAGQPVRLAEYRVPDFLIDRVEMDISLSRESTRVAAELSLRRVANSFAYGMRRRHRVRCRPGF